MKKLLIVPLLISIALISVFAMSIKNQKVESPVTQSIDYVGIACVSKTDGLTGEVTDVGCNHNLITNYGLEVIKNALNGTSVNYNLTNLTLGGNVSAMAATDTDLVGLWTSTQGLGPALATYARLGNGNSSLNYQWTASGASTWDVNSTGIYNKTSGTGVLFAEASFTNVQLSGPNGDKLNVTYYWWIA